ncbi:MAG: spore coat associated protein CotJA [Bacillota bacterium]|nr:MAG: hypothetical protein DIU66_04470 [Bacillota bacterium]
MNKPDGKSKGYPGGMRLGEAYVPFQIYGETFDPKTALMYGTLFPDLFRPYRPAHRNQEQ